MRKLVLPLAHPLPLQNNVPVINKRFGSPTNLVIHSACKNIQEDYTYLRMLDSSVSNSIRNLMPTETRVWYTALTYLPRGMTNSDGQALKLEAKTSNVNLSPLVNDKCNLYLGLKNIVNRLFVAAAWAAAARRPMCMLSLDNTEEGKTACGRLARRIPKSNWLLSFLTGDNSI